MTRVGAVDCGTNSIRLLVADVDPPTGSLIDVVRRMEVVRLGAGVDRTGTIEPEAMARTLSMVREYAGQCQELGAATVRFVATSASRDASNAAEFVAGVRQAFFHFGTVPEVVTGDEEAALSFRGATGGLRARGIPGPYLVVDLGGGSTEWVRGEATAKSAISMDIGSVRLTERHLHSDPPRPDEIAAAVRDIDAALDHAAQVVDIAGIGTLVGLAGSVTTITAHALGLPEYDPDRTDLAELSPDQVLVACEDLLHRTREQRAALGFMHPGRVDVIGAGALVWHQVVQRLAGVGVRRVVTSEHDILDGIARSAAERFEAKA